MNTSLFHSPRSAVLNRKGTTVVAALLVAILQVISALPAMGQGQADRPGDGPLWIAVTAPGLAEAIEPLARRRADEGFDIRILDDTKLRTDRQRAAHDVEPIRRAVRQLTARTGPTAAGIFQRKRAAVLVFVGREPGAGAKGDEPCAVPGGLGAADNMAGQPSDAVAGDLDGDDRPDVSVGRLPARHADELKAMIGKVVRFESQKAPAEWQHRFVLLAGSPDYGAVIDRLIESLVGAALDRLDGRWVGMAFYDNPNSAFCLPQPLLRQSALSAITQGNAVTVYMGRSSPRGFFLSRQDLGAIRIAGGAGPLFALSCLGGVFSPEGDGFSIEAMRNADGPVATFAAAAVSQPHWNKLLAEGLERSFFNGRPERLGEVIDGMRRHLAEQPLDMTTLMALKLAGKSGQDHAAQRRAHVQMYSLFGDPATRLPWTVDWLDLRGPGYAAAGATVRLTGRLANRTLDGAKVKVLVRRAFTAIPPADDRAESAEVRHGRANRVELATAEATVAGDRFEAAVRLPPDAPGRYVVARAWAVGAGDRQAVGSCRIELTGK